MAEQAWEIPTIPKKEHSSSSSDSPVPGALPNCCPPGMRCSWGWLWLTLPSQGFSEPTDSVSPPFPSFPGPGLYSRLTSLLLNYRCASSALGPGSARSSTSASGHPQKANTKPEDVLSSQTLGCCRRIIPVPLNHPAGSVCTDLPLSALFPALSSLGKSKKIMCLFPDFIPQCCPWCPATV